MRVLVLVMDEYCTRPVFIYQPLCAINRYLNYDNMSRIVKSNVGYMSILDGRKSTNNGLTLIVFM